MTEKLSPNETQIFTPPYSIYDVFIDSNGNGHRTATEACKASHELVVSRKFAHGTDPRFNGSLNYRQRQFEREQVLKSQFVELVENKESYLADVEFLEQRLIAHGFPPHWFGNIPIEDRIDTNGVVYYK